MVLADDLLGNGEAHLVVASASGRLIALTTSLELPPLAAVYVHSLTTRHEMLLLRLDSRRSHAHGRMGAEYGIYVEGPRFRQVHGRWFKVPFRIVDTSDTLLAPYNMSVRTPCYSSRFASPAKLKR